jgi:hypothetical protein
MGVEGEHPGQPSALGGCLHGALDDRLVTHVDAIENPEREVQRHAEGRQIFEAVTNQHALEITRREMGFKSELEVSFFPTIATVVAAGVFLRTGEFKNENEQRNEDASEGGERLPVHVRSRRSDRFGRR